MKILPLTTRNKSVCLLPCGFLCLWTGDSILRRFPTMFPRVHDLLPHVVRSVRAKGRGSARLVGGSPSLFKCMTQAAYQYRSYFTLLYQVK